MTNKIQAKGSFSFEITTVTSCDMACTYCFEGEKALDTNQVNKRIPEYIEKIKETLNAEWFKKDYEFLSLDFWGGEPTLNNYVMTRLINEFKDYDNIDFHLYTNAFNESTMRKFIESIDPSKLRIQVSYDGRVINDKFRIDHSGNSTSDKVLSTFEYLSTINLKGLNLKSTLPLSECHHMTEVWKEFRELHNKYASKNVYVRYAPTLDYHTKFQDPNTYLPYFENAIREISAMEIDFFKENGYFLFTWYRGTDERFTCSAGKNMTILDTDGNFYPCHGALYLDDKEDHKVSSLGSDINNINREKYAKMINKTNEICNSCVATTCFVCPTSSYAASQKETYEERWLDNQVHGLCGYYQAFGKVDRAFSKLLGGN
jgi:radical SAM protein with 4Fe4S-binding SPASM domain